jgi:hypothetical protein
MWWDIKLIRHFGGNQSMNFFWQNRKFLSPKGRADSLMWMSPKGRKISFYDTTIGFNGRISVIALTALPLGARQKRGKVVRAWISTRLGIQTPKSGADNI